VIPSHSQQSVLFFPDSALKEKEEQSKYGLRGFHEVLTEKEFLNCNKAELSCWLHIEKV